MGVSRRHLMTKGAAGFRPVACVAGVEALYAQMRIPCTLL